MATVTIKDIRVKARIGIEPRELKDAQDVLLTISFEYDARKAAKSDNIKDAVDYKAMHKRILALLKRSRFNLVEKMADEILGLVVADKRVKNASVTITKPRALQGASGVSLTVRS